jgi:aryl-alcohol dehydrogenase-like predicted oxidoreductase
MEGSMMEQRELGRGGPRVSALGLGAWPFGGGMGRMEEQVVIDTVHAAIDHGITFIDTAEAYRGSEALIGKALVGGLREKVFLATKVSGNFTPEHIRQAMENSLRALQTDYVDLYQIHWWEGRVPIEESMAAMEALRKEGKTRYLGVSNFDVPQMEAARAAAPFVSLQPRYNLLDREIEGQIAPWCEREGIGILVHSPLAKGALTGRYGPGHVFPEDDERSRFPRFQGETYARIAAATDQLRREVAQPRGLSLVQLAVGWTLRLPAVSVCLVGAKNRGQIREHVGAQGWRLSTEELARIDSILDAIGRPN